MILIDAHCHLELKDFAVPQEVIARAKQQNLRHAIVVGLLQKPGDFGNALELSRENKDFLTPTMGIHPHDAGSATVEDWVELERRCALPEVAGVGETGLDYFRNLSTPQEQETSFRRQCGFAKKFNKPIVIHVRDAHEDCARILKEEGMTRGMIHCFTGNKNHAQVYLDLGFYLSISGVVTYKNSQALQEAVQFAPLDRLMVETDSPYLTPIPHRGKQNEPGMVAHTAAKVADLKGADAELVALTCAKNTSSLFGLKLEL